MKLNLKGELIPDEWAQVYRYFGFDSGFYCPGDIRAALDALADGEELVLLINSVGGDVFAANEIYAMLQADSHPIRAEIQSLAASAASYFPLACDRVDIALPAQMMIHCAGWDVGGNKADHRWAADQLEVTDEAILDVYCRKCGPGADREKLRTLMEEETYLSASRCVELGLADGVLGADEDASEPLNLVASVSGNTIRAMRTRPDIRPLMRQWEEKRRMDQWGAHARLTLEQNRYHRA